MIGKVCVILCLQAVFLQSISAQGCGCDCYDGFSKTTTYSTGGPVTVTCSGPLSSNGLSLNSDLCMDGTVEVCGSMPFLSAVAIEGTVPTSGSGTVGYGCGDTNSIVIYQESGNPSGNNAASRSGLSLGNLAQCGCRYQ